MKTRQKPQERGRINDKTGSPTAQASTQLQSDRWAPKLPNLAESLLQPSMLSSATSYRSKKKKKIMFQLANTTNSSSL